MALVRRLVRRAGHILHTILFNRTAGLIAVEIATRVFLMGGENSRGNTHTSICQRVFVFFRRNHSTKVHRSSRYPDEVERILAADSQ